MRAYYLIVIAAGLMAFGDAAHATTRDVEKYLEKAGAVATAQVSAAGVDVGQGVRFQARVSSDGRLLGAHVVTSSGSPEVDQNVERVLRRLHVQAPPNTLIGADVTIAVGSPGFVQAKTP